MEDDTGTTVVTTRIGFKFNCEPAYTVERWIAQYGEWESHLRPILDYFIKPGMVCVDVGANSGYHALGMSHRIGGSGEVLAFEPSARNFQRLLKNLDLNPELARRIRTVRAGLSDTRQELKVFTGGLEGNAYLLPDEKLSVETSSRAADLENCLVMPLDSSLLAERLDFMKIDVEGMEMQVLRGAEEMIRRHRPVIVYETLLDCFDHAGLQEIESWFHDRDYSLLAREEKSGLLVPVRYPYYLEDTVAVPSERLLGISDFLFSAAWYEVAADDGAPAGVLLLCAGSNGYLAARFGLFSLQEDRSIRVEGDGESPRYEFAGAVPIVLEFDSREHAAGTIEAGGFVLKLRKLGGALPADVGKGFV